MSIFDNYLRIRDDVNKIAESCGRDPGSIKIIAISKTFPAETVQHAIDSGIKIIGESKVQEAKHKARLLKGGFSLHMVGHLQSNKAKDAVKLFDVIHSIDKISTALKVNAECEKNNKIQDILVQVNTSEEDSKSGVSQNEALGLCSEILTQKNLTLLGLMTIGHLSDNEDSIRASFRMLRKLLYDINSKLGIKMTELSMGMTSDYQIAVEEGATMIRIGSAIFGHRNYSI